MNVIEIEDVHKAYEDVAVLRGVSLHVMRGTVYGLLGPNGSGKTTLIHVMLGFLRPDRGTLRVLGSNQLQRIDGRVGYVPERLRYHTRYTAREYLHYLGRFSNLSGAALSSRINAELGAVGLTAVADRQLSTFSRGMLQRIGIAQALLSEPELLLIDEPTSGLDPGGQHDVIALLDRVRTRGCTIFMATHFLDEAELLCDRIGILHAGRIAAETEMHRLRGPGGSVVITVEALPPGMAEMLASFSPAVRCIGQEITLAPNTPALQARVLRALLDGGVAILSLVPQHRPIEEFYLRAVRGEKAPDRASQAMEPSPDAIVPPPPGPSGTGDTLLRELLSREEGRQRSEPESDA